MLLEEHQISKGQLSADISSTETIYCLIISLVRAPEILKGMR